MQPASTPNLTTEKSNLWLTRRTAPIYPAPLSFLKGCQEVPVESSPHSVLYQDENLFLQGQRRRHRHKDRRRAEKRKRGARWAKGQGRRKLCQRAYVCMEKLGELLFSTKRATELSHRHGSARPVSPPASLRVERVIFQSSVYSRTVSAILSCLLCVRGGAGFAKSTNRNAETSRRTLISIVGARKREPVRRADPRPPREG